MIYDSILYTGQAQVGYW